MDDLASSIAALQSAAADLGRGHVPVTAMLVDATPESLAGARAAGADRALVMLPEASADDTLRLIDRHAELLAHLPAS
jgi:hypothetical protein